MLSADDWIEIPEGFRGFDWRGAMVVYRRNLPHWRQRGATYFVTFRLADSLPAAVVESLRGEARIWEKRFAGLKGKMPPVGMAEEWRRFQRASWILVEDSLDEAHGACPFGEPGCRGILDEGLRRYAGERYDLWAFAIMPNHGHVCVRPRDEWSLEAVLQGWKGESSRRINEYLGRSATLWQADTYDRIVRDDAHFRKVIRYIANNPEKAGIGDDGATTEIFVKTGSEAPG